MPARSRISGAEARHHGRPHLPGAMALTRMPFGPSCGGDGGHEADDPRLGRLVGRAPCAAERRRSEETQMTAPPPRSPGGTAAWVVSSMDLRSTAITRSQFSSVVVEQALARHDADVVVKDVEPAPALAGGLHHGAAVHRARDVGRKGHGGAALSWMAATVSRARACLGIDAEHARALPGKEDGGGLAVAEAGPARARTGDDGDLAGEARAHATPRRPLSP